MVLYNASSCGFLVGMTSNQSCECSCKVLIKMGSDCCCFSLNRIPVSVRSLPKPRDLEV